MPKGADRGQAGFTLVELMIVVAIVAILAAIGAVRYQSMVQKTREGTTKGNAASVRIALAIYYGDREGVWPTTLDPAGWQNHLLSVYLDKMPEVALTQAGPSSQVSALASGAVPTAPGVGWAYDSDKGRIYVNSNYNDSNGNSYTTY